MTQDLVTVKDIATRLGFSPWAVRRWQRDVPNFPGEEMKVGGTGIYLYDWRKIEKWARETGRYPD